MEKTTFYTIDLKATEPFKCMYAIKTFYKRHKK